MGSASVNSKVDSEIDDAVTLGAILFEYHLNKHYSVAAKYYEGDNFFNGIGLIGRDFDIKGFQLSFKAKTPISARWNAYGRLGTNVYQTKFSGQGLFEGIFGLDEEPNNTDNKVGVAAAIGFEFNAKNGFFLGLEYEYLPMNDVELSGANFFIGFSF